LGVEKAVRDPVRTGPFFNLLVRTILNARRTDSFGDDSKIMNGLEGSDRQPKAPCPAVRPGAGPASMGRVARPVEGGDQMVSFWWVVAGIAGGGFVGIMLMALMRMSGDIGERPPNAPDLNGMP